MPKHYLLYVEQPYSFAILRPLQDAIRAKGDLVYWFITSESVAAKNLLDGEVRLHTVNEVKAINPRAVFVPGNIVPDFFPGAKVQVFHGLEYKKKGHFNIRGFFDLYCTHGPLTTKEFEKLSVKYKYFSVAETGWPKLDPYFNYVMPKNKKPIILYAPTFSPNLTSLDKLYHQIKELAESDKYQIKLKFHPKTDKKYQQMYQGLTKLHNFEIATENNLIPLIQESNLVISDTSSAIDEALLLGKTVISFKNKQPQDALINIESANLLPLAIEQAFNLDKEQLSKVADYINQVHPYRDGKSAERVLAATEEVLKAGLKSKPLNLFRKYKVRKKLSYMKLK